MLEIRDLEAFGRWIATSQKGSRIIYHKCFDPYGRDQLINVREKNRHVNDLANLAWDSYSGGQVHLFQQRVDGRRVYLAEKR